MTKFSVTIFLPAAGLGERLRPITNHLPKPLLPVLGKPLIERTLEKLTSVCSGKIGINLHYKPDMIRAWARKSSYADRIEFFPENPILGTGGALKNAERFLLGSPFLVHNSDILLDIDFSLLIKTHLSSGNIATLVTHDYPKFNNVVVDDSGYLIDVENPGTSRPNENTTGRKVAYTGIAVYSPEILRFLPPGISHATVAWIAAAAAGRKVRTLDFTGCSWNDIGTPATYASAILDALRNQGEMVSLSPASSYADFEFDGYLVTEGKGEITKGARLRNCIVLPGARVSGSHENTIVGPDYAIELSESEMQPTAHAIERKKVSLADPLFASYFSGSLFPGKPDDFRKAGERKAEGEKSVSPSPLPPPPSRVHDTDAILIGLGGSDRRYYRVRHEGKSAVYMECRADDPDYERHLVYTRFFEAHQVPVPKILGTDEPRKTALFEDLGDTSLYSYLKAPHPDEDIESVYRHVLDILIKLHTRATKDVNKCPLLKKRIFDYDYLRWETTYFLERFLEGLRKIRLENRRALENEFHRLAKTVDALPRGIIHRDFQCQNIMMTAGGIPRVIDYQGARMAPPAYDIASILWDPYYRLNDTVRQKLIDYYVHEMKAEKGFREKTFHDSLILCRLQRHMQALGAYGFLSEIKGKKYFRKHIPEALSMLKEETTRTKSDFPNMYQLVRDLD